MVCILKSSYLNLATGTSAVTSRIGQIYSEQIAYINKTCHGCRKPSEGAFWHGFNVLKTKPSSQVFCIKCVPIVQESPFLSSLTGNMWHSDDT